ncbi:MAG: dihydrofolate reductase family protein [Kofleriaceae bacterium]
MRKLKIFNNVTMDGFFTGANGDMRWAHQNADAEWNEFTSENARGKAAFVFGRKTYDMMVSFWPTDEAKKQMPEVAKAMNESPKYVFSRSLDKAEWSSTKLVKGDVGAQLKALKEESGPDLLIMGSGSIIGPATQAGLIDAFTIVMHPLVLGIGKSMFAGVEQRQDYTLESSRSFKNGNVVVTYTRRA